MKYIACDYLDKPLSKVILGTSSPCFWRGENCEELLDAALSLGISTVDTARGYGKSEEVIGNFLEKSGKRKDVVLQSKGGLHGLLGNSRITRRCIRKDLDESLKRLKTDCIDLYLLHRDDERKTVGELLSLLNELKAEGKITAFGASNWTARRIEEANEYAYAHNMQPFSVSQAQYSLTEVVRWSWLGCQSASGEKNERELAWYEKTGLPLMAYSPLGGGYLSGKLTSEQIRKGARLPSNAKAYQGEVNLQRLKRAEELAQEKGVTTPQIALAYLLCSPVNSLAVVGSSTPTGLQNNAKAVDLSLREEELRYLYSGE